MNNANRFAVRWLQADIAALMLFLIATLLSPLSHAEDAYLSPDAAFKVTAKMIDANDLEVRYDIASGYYMYRERFAFKAGGATLGVPAYPAGHVKFDETFQKSVETYRQSVTIRIPVQADGRFNLTVTGQGCADQGLCYPPMTKTVELDAGVAATRSQAPDPNIEESKISASLQSGKLITILPLFLLLGLGLAFTPCVLPMVPILSSIIVGDRAGTSRGRGLLLSSAYSLGMSAVYTLLGVAAGLAGEGLAATMQNPYVLGAFAALMVLLALSMFGLYQLQMPGAIQARLMQASDRQSSGRLMGVFVMGALSALIVGPCVAAPLAGVLVYIGQTRNVFIGASALFAMAVGMSLPLLLVGASAGTLLPRTGPWMESIKRFFGVLMLGTALWLISPIIPVALQMLAWATLGMGYAGWLFFQRSSGRLAKSLALLFAGLGLIQLMGVATGGNDVLAPLSRVTGNSVEAMNYKRVKSTAELDRLLATHPEQPMMLDFYADWCVSCKEMEKLTFSDPQVRSQLAGMLLLQADVTENNADDKALLKRFTLFGPPGIIFFDASGREITSSRVIGYQNADRFLQTLSRVRTM